MFLNFTENFKILNVYNFFIDRFSAIERSFSAMTLSEGKTNISALQEVMQKQGRPLPGHIQLNS